MREEYMIERQGKRFVLYAGLLEEAHSRGLRSIETDLVQVPTKENGEVAIVKAVIRATAPLPSFRVIAAPLVVSLHWRCLRRLLLRQACASNHLPCQKRIAP